MSTTDLGVALKRLVRARRTKVATLARQVDVSVSTLYAYLAGTTLPSTEVLDALLHALEAPGTERHRLATARDALARARRRSEDAPPASPPRPQELPQAPAGFAGRADLLARIDEADRADRRGARVTVLAGPAGVGKTALALTWAHTAVEQFPDGCLYVDLRGFSPGEPRRPGDVLDGFLRSLGDRDVPDDLDDRARRFRSLTAGRRLLLLLDNALEEAQVRPLLPGHGTTRVLVTSRRDLAGLQVDPGATRVPVAPLTPEESGLLLATLLGSPAAGAVGDVPTEEWDEAVARCAGLPLALRLLGARAAGGGRDADAAATELLAELRARPGLDAFDVGDGTTSARAVFSWSERHLDAPARRAFHLMGLAPVPDLSPDELGALLATDPPTTSRMLDTLVRTHLVQPAPGRRFGMHDLVGEHARERGAAEVASEEREAALARLVDEVVARGADSLPWSHHVALIDDAVQAARWEHVVALVRSADASADQNGRNRETHGLLREGLRAAETLGDLSDVSAFASLLGVSCVRLGRFDEAFEFFDRSWETAELSGEPGLRAGCLNNLGMLYERLGRAEEALDCFARALPLAEEMGSVRGQAVLANNAGTTLKGLERYDEALAYLRECVDLVERAGLTTEDPGLLARAEANLADCHRGRGETDTALEVLDRALTRAREIDARHIETEALCVLGGIHLATHALAAADEAYAAARALALHIGSSFDAAIAEEGLGRVALTRGDVEVARRRWTEARARLVELDLPDAGRLEGRLADLAAAARGSSGG